jgi:SAM-dependent methyltransferase
MTNDPVKAQYEAFPYPARDPRDEAKRLVVGSPSHLLEINHYVFAGRRDWSRPFRVLFAGGGTGDGTIMLAQQLAERGVPAEIVYLDLSTASRAIAEARARQREIGGIEFHTGSLLDLPGLGLAPFDYIDCCGVLHHLDDPAAGLGALAGALAPGGGMGLMLYGALGRTGVYHVQAILRALAGDLAVRERPAFARRLLEHLPRENWFKLNPFLGDHVTGGDAGLYDLLLHERDRAYTVPEIVALLETAGLAPAAFIEPARYDPASYLNDPQIRRRLMDKGWLERAALAELVAGNMTKHVVYAVPAARASDAVARPTPEAVPVFREVDGQQMARGLRPAATLRAQFETIMLRFPMPALAPAIAARIDGIASLEAIHKDLQATVQSSLDWSAFLAQFDTFYAAFNGMNQLLLRFPPAPHPIGRVPPGAASA